MTAACRDTGEGVGFTVVTKGCRNVEEANGGIRGMNAMWSMLDWARLTGIEEQICKHSEC